MRKSLNSDYQVLSMTIKGPPTKPFAFFPMFRFLLPLAITASTASLFLPVYAEESDDYRFTIEELTTKIERRKNRATNFIVRADRLVSEGADPQSKKIVRLRSRAEDHTKIAKKLSEEKAGRLALQEGLGGEPKESPPEDVTPDNDPQEEERISIIVATKESDAFSTTGTMWERDLSTGALSILTLNDEYKSFTMDSSVSNSKCGNAEVCSFTYSKSNGFVGWIDNTDKITTSISITIDYHETNGNISLSDLTTGSFNHNNNPKYDFYYSTNNMVFDINKTTGIGEIRLRRTLVHNRAFTDWRRIKIEPGTVASTEGGSDKDPFNGTIKLSNTPHSGITVNGETIKPPNAVAGKIDITHGDYTSYPYNLKAVFNAEIEDD